MKCEGKPEDAMAVLLDMVQKAELQADEAQKVLETVEPKYKKARRAAYVKEAELKGEDPDARYDLVIGLNGLEDIVVNHGGDEVDYGNDDVDNATKIKRKKIPLIIDRTGTALTYLTYRAVTILDLANGRQMSPDQLRLAVIGGLRYGKPMLINLRNKDLSEAFVTLQHKFSRVAEDMFLALVKGQARDEKVYRKWITDDIVKQHPEFHFKMFVPSDTLRFRFILLTHEEQPQDWEVLGNFYSVLVQ
jgi:hypothetical protein